MGAQITLPDGTWKDSAKDYYFDQSTGYLTALLLTSDGSITQSSTIATYGMSLENDNGRFKIVSKGYSNNSALHRAEYSNVLPAGNWFFTARNIQFDNNILSAELKNSNQIYTHSTIVVFEGFVVENCNGEFRIVKQYVNPNQFSNLNYFEQNKYLPLGSWINSAGQIKFENVQKDTCSISALLKKTDGTANKCFLTYRQFDIYDNDNGNFKYVGNCANSIKS